MSRTALVELESFILALKGRPRLDKQNVETALRVQLEETVADALFGNKSPHWRFYTARRDGPVERVDLAEPVSHAPDRQPRVVLYLREADAPHWDQIHGQRGPGELAGPDFGQPARRMGFYYEGKRVDLIYEAELTSGAIRQVTVQQRANRGGPLQG